MRSGFVLRNSANSTTYGITDITTTTVGGTTKRTTLPKWAAIAEGFATLANYSSQTLSNGDYVFTGTTPATLYGPATNYVNGSTTYSLGRYIGDYDFLGDRGQSQGPTGSFDLDQYNGRNCVTPEFPSGTYAYFVTIDANGNPAFPYMLGKQYYGTKSGTSMNVTVPTTGVTELFNSGGLNAQEVMATPIVNPSSGNVTLTWSSVEGGSYRVEASDNLQTWTTLNPALSAAVNTSLPAPDTVITQTSTIDAGAALLPANQKRFYRVKRN